MRFEFCNHSLPQTIDKNLNAFPTSKLECRDQIAVTRNNNNRIHKLAKRQSCDIKTNTQINSLLHNIWLKISRDWQSGIPLHVFRRRTSQFPPMDDGLT